MYNHERLALLEYTYSDIMSIVNIQKYVRGWLVRKNANNVSMSPSLISTTLITTTNRISSINSVKKDRTLMKIRASNDFFDTYDNEYKSDAIGCCLPGVKKKSEKKSISFYRKRVCDFTIVYLKFDTNNLDEKSKFIIHKHNLESCDLMFLIGKTCAEITCSKIRVLQLFDTNNQEYIDLYLNLGFSKQTFTNFKIDYKPDIGKEVDVDDFLLTLHAYCEPLPSNKNHIFDYVSVWDEKDTEFQLIHNHYKYFLDEDYKITDEIKEIIITSLQTDVGFEEQYINNVVCSYISNYSKLLDFYENYIEYETFVENFKQLKNYNFCDTNQEYYSSMINNPAYFLKKIIEEYKNYINSSYKDTLPDIYMICGAVSFPNKYEKNLNKHMQLQYKPVCHGLNKFSDLFFNIFKQCGFWYYINLLVSFCAQILAPIYYIYDYLIVNNNSICPNESVYQLKILSVIFFLTLYSQYNDMQDKILKSQYKFSHTYFIKHSNALILSFVINQAVTFLIPVITFLLFLQDPTILGFILNCLTATFLVELDNMIVIANSGTDLLNVFVEDSMIIAFIDKGLRYDNFIKNVYKNRFVMSLTIIVEMLQVLLMFFLCVMIGYCL